MRYVKPDVQTICFGMAMSMGAILLAGGAKGKRMALPNSKIMIHQGHTTGFEGQATDVEIRAREILIAAAADGGDAGGRHRPAAERIHEDTQRDNFMNAEQAREYGLIDNVVSERSVVNGRRLGLE